MRYIRIARVVFNRDVFVGRVERVGGVRVKEKERGRNEKLREEEGMREVKKGRDE